MPRSRSRSAGRRDRDRHLHSRSHSRERRRHRHRDRSRSPGGSRLHRSHKLSRSRSPGHRRQRSKSPDIFNKAPSNFSHSGGRVMDVTTGATNPTMLSLELQAPAESSQEGLEMMQLMGFGGFDSSKGKQHTDGSTKAHGSNIQVKRKYRQYMNRRGGFNKPLDRVA